MNGILVINKPMDYTSHDIVAIVRGIVGEKHLGHTGTLDPNATGVLPICLGNSTRLIEYMDSGRKSYDCVCKLGTITDTQDIWGNVLSETKSCFSLNDIEAVIPKFIGKIEQVPSKYSAIRVNGRHLYSYAHSGEEISVPARTVEVFSLVISSFDMEKQEFSMSISCSRGTYIRSICNDIGEVLGCGAVMKSLVRTSCSGYTLDDAFDFEELRKMKSEDVISLIKPMESAVSFMPRIDISPEQYTDFANGKHLKVAQKNMPFDEEFTVFCEDKLVGIGIWDNPNRVKPKKVFIIR